LAVAAFVLAILTLLFSNLRPIMTTFALGCLWVGTLGLSAIALAMSKQ